MLGEVEELVAFPIRLSSDLCEIRMLGSSSLVAPSRAVLRANEGKERELKVAAIIAAEGARRSDRCCFPLVSALFSVFSAVCLC